MPADDTSTSNPLNQLSHVVSAAEDPSRLKAEGVQIDVQNLCYGVQVGNEAFIKNILHDVSFRLRPGSMCALMGPSGSGKSTLLDLLADRKLVGQWSGEIYFNHGPRSRYFNRDSAYILQDDLHFATLTVRETIYYSACFKLPEGTSKEMIDARVEELLKLMGLSHVANSLVGDATHKGISGGQMKRLSIAVEIVHLPEIIFLDEPTSGLDSTMALEVMTAVKVLANQNRTCITTIHQPSPEVFELFDKVVLLVEGRLVYYGSSKKVLEYFTGEPLCYFYEDGQNPAEFIIDIGEGIIKPFNRMKALTTEELEAAYLQSNYRYVAPAQTAIDAAHQRSSELAKSDKGRLHATSKTTQFFLLTRRNLLAIVRDLPEIQAQLAKNIIVGLLIGIIFYQQARVTDTPVFDPLTGQPLPEVTNISSLLFFGTMFTMVSNIQAIPYLISRNLIFRREVASFAYSVAPYWLSHCLTVIPIQLLGFTLFFLAVYFLCDFNQSSDYMTYYFLMMFFSSMNAFYYAMLLAGALQSQKLALVFYPISFLFLSTFAGYAIPVDTVPPGWYWATFIDYVRWTFQGLMVNQWESYDDDSTGQTVLDLYGMEGYDKNNSYWTLSLATGIILVGVYIAMRPPRNHLKKVSQAQFKQNNSLRETLNSLHSSTEPSTVNSKGGLQEKLLDENEEAEEEKRGSGFQRPVLKKMMSDLESSKSASERALNFEIDSSGVKPLHGYYLTFRNVSYEVEVVNTTTGNTETLKILRQVSGRVEPNQMCALMGASGAGKSTLLDVLADRKTTGSITGEIYINGKERTKAMMKSTAYVMQDNAHIAALTVKETLYFAALLRLPQSMSDLLKHERVDDIMRVLGLQHISESIVGNEERRGISGGQKKRLSIGVEIIHMPEMIFLDEPTTGLDSAIAYEVMFAVRQIANQHRTILCTIHQPSKSTFELFDTVMLLGAGQMFYYGPRALIANYFTTCQYQFPMKPGSNPADFIIAISCQAIPSAATQTTISSQQLIEMYQETTSYKDFYQKIEEYLTTDRFHLQQATSRLPHLTANQLQALAASEETSSSYHTSLFFQIQTLVYRMVVRRRRDWKTTLVVTVRYIFVALFYGTIFYQLDTGTDPTVYSNRLSILFFTLLSLLMNHQEEIPELHEDRLIFYREKSAHAYSPFAYWASKVLIAIPFDLVNVFLYAVVLYYLTGLRASPSEDFGFFVMIVWINSFIALFICQLIAFISPSTEIAMSIFPIILFFTTAFEGFIIYIPEFPEWLGWAANISYMRFAFQALVLNEFQGNDGDLPNENYYITELGFDTFTKTQCATFLLIFLGLHGIVAYLAVEWINFEKR